MRHTMERYLIHAMTSYGLSVHGSSVEVVCSGDEIWHVKPENLRYKKRVMKSKDAALRWAKRTALRNCFNNETLEIVRDDLYLNTEPVSLGCCRYEPGSVQVQMETEPPRPRRYYVALYRSFYENGRDRATLDHFGVSTKEEAEDWYDSAIHNSYIKGYMIWCIESGRALAVQGFHEIPPGFDLNNIWDSSVPMEKAA